MNEIKWAGIPPISIGWIIALIVLVIAIVLMVVRGPDTDLGLIAALALARML